MPPRPSRRRGRDVHGILLLDKPLGSSSNGALQMARRIYRATKAGHTGNLDVRADGLLPVCFGQATKVCAFLLDADKRYVAEFRLGAATTTGDAEGEVNFRGDIAGLDRAQVERAADRFRGEFKQLPPMYSALKHHGQPLYKLAHLGLEVERAPRQVCIHRLDIRYLDQDRLGVEVWCSKGTYIRTLAQDIGNLLGCGAHVVQLRRTMAGPFDIAHAHTLADLDRIAGQGEVALDALLLPMDSALAGIACLNLDVDASFQVRRGQPVRVPGAPSTGLVRLYDRDARFIGVGAVQVDGRIAPRRLMADAVAAV